LIAQQATLHFEPFSAVLGGVAQVREAVAAAQARRARTGTLLFVDEIHRFNKAQQDAFLPHVESGLVTFIGATTETPSFEMNAALLSRAAVYVLKPLSHDELLEVVERASAALSPHPPIHADARELLVGHADGDARRLINLVDQVVAVALSAEPPSIDQDFVQ
jgi:putative ATPase